MKKTLILLILILVFTSCKAQTINSLTYNDYTNLKVNGISLEQINNTRGQLTDINQLFTFNFQSEEISIPDSYRILSSLGFNVEFLNDSSQSDYELNSFIITSSNISFEVTGHTISVGDNISILNDFLPNGSNKAFLFKIDESDNQFLTRENYVMISYSALNIITKIEFITL